VPALFKHQNLLAHRFFCVWLLGLHALNGRGPFPYKRVVQPSLGPFVPGAFRKFAVGGFPRSPPFSARSAEEKTRTFFPFPRGFGLKPRSCRIGERLSGFPPPSYGTVSTEVYAPLSFPVLRIRFLFFSFLLPGVKGGVRGQPHRHGVAFLLPVCLRDN